MHEGPAAFAPALDCVCCGSAVTCSAGVYTSCAQRPRRARLGKAQGGACKVYRQLFKKSARPRAALLPVCALHAFSQFARPLFPLNFSIPHRTSARALYNKRGVL